MNNQKSFNHLDLTRKKFGELTVLEEVKQQKEKRKRSYWKCQCSCGNIIEVRGSALTSGNTKSCGCLNREKIRERNFEDLSRKTFGFLTVTKESEIKNNKRYWKCICKCGTECWVPTAKLKNGHTKSCGCIRNSYGEAKIKNLLTENNICFKKEFSPKDLKFPSRKKARFDFAIFSEQKQVLYFIEFDGSQHFFANNKGWNNQKNHEELVARDLLKNQYCKEKNIPLIRIPYFDIEKITIEDLKINSKYLYNF